MDCGRLRGRGACLWASAGSFGALGWPPDVTCMASSPVARQPLVWCTWAAPGSGGFGPGADGRTLLIPTMNSSL